MVGPKLLSFSQIIISIVIPELTKKTPTFCQRERDALNSSSSSGGQVVPKVLVESFVKEGDARANGVWGGGVRTLLVY